MNKRVLGLLLFLTPIPSFLLALVVGQVVIPLNQIVHPSGLYSIIIYKIRLPTIVTAILVGVSLSISGAIMQHLLRNPIVDPYISGTASGGALGAVLSYFLFSYLTIPFLQPLMAFLFSLVSTGLTILIGKRGGIYGLVVGGVVVSYIFTSIYTILLTILEEKDPQIPPLLFWLLGEVSVVGWGQVMPLVIMTFALVSLSLFYSKTIDLVSISDEISYAHGVNPQAFRLFWLVFISLVVSYEVSLVGVIGFVGILIPHLVRKMVGGNMRDLTIYSSVLGASLMLIGNVISHAAFGTLIPVTPIIALMASPVLISLLVRLNDGQRVEG
ncbi:FecCD family ABC transporter permease [Stygiolobus caldivivus]|uniref:Iron ABC transporter n=1 Tax=Stygiolobus caldivivus TaxID=2824673 RepID=A0A8D5U7V5_9CREN|nr:iron ABC transporter permease [Stygiolobus caldivivus]BCU70953.1 iron ABC transporter [Stygiolobus caldivivus]